MGFQYEPGRYFKNDAAGRLIAEITFQELHDGTVYAIDHTFVRDDHRGEGIASQLVKAVIQRAQASNVKIMPICSYAKSFFQRKPEYQGLLAK
ncbi:GNAT family N-acetyltransferase [Loigolactobacillus backii]|uniref:Acetyltransferase n=1 Tax=Loigolactobacillus backii TaxID=375175 RepID=A0A192H0X4_9LACO|nr:GNAT family N-acetyltransferase [Loigolactobacillus backii]ANK59076.1 acetyltransferase [Loigolactobacillus backii]ANK62454.1 acetyltransferase [Loigolactobacillus backii]ANK64065.1 acetyltransferase [Loigolactobacillus backii]ANK67541.1 acetyltransferase [Loigolactobacillus backii]ANK70534.1 acetyltransferase [Loigolactobacillus backii]